MYLRFLRQYIVSYIYKTIEQKIIRHDPITENKVQWDSITLTYTHDYQLDQIMGITVDILDM